MSNKQKQWHKLTALLLCALPDLETKQHFLKEAGITLPEILEEISIWGDIWKQYNVNGHDLRPLKLSITEWLKDYNDPIKGKVMYAFATMKLNYVFQMYAFHLAPKYRFLDEFKKNFSTKAEIDLAMDFIERARKQSKLPPIDTMMSWMEEDISWVKKTWGL